MTASHPVAHALEMHDAPLLAASAASPSGMCFLELRCDRRDAGRSGAVREDAILVALQLRRCTDFDLYADGRLVQPHDFDAGAVALFDLRQNLACDLRDPFHAVDLYVPLPALNACADDAGLPRLSELRQRPGAAVRDPVLRDLLSAMRSALAAPPAEAVPLFIDHVAIAVATHVAHTYGNAARVLPSPRGGLASWQLRRALALLEAHLHGGIALTDLARACELSVRHFTRAFRRSTGLAPHEWLVRHRIERAQQCLARSSQPLADIALHCGFTDQSHLSRTFRRATGVTPGAWRRLHRER